MLTSQGPPSDESLVTAALGSGGATSFAQLVRRYERSARATCLAVLRDHHLACDAAQEAFVAAYKSLAALRDRSAFGAWLTTIARNRAIRLARGRKITTPLTSSMTQPFDREPEDFELLSAISALPEHERIVILLRYFQNHEVRAIAEILGRPVGTITKQLSRAHERLRHALTEEIAP
jgi:RNA polymerase sigma-70 factor (ECF subfamily)